MMQLIGAEDVGGKVGVIRDIVIKPTQITTAVQSQTLNSSANGSALLDFSKVSNWFSKADWTTWLVVGAGLLILWALFGGE